MIPYFLLLFIPLLFQTVMQLYNIRLKPHGKDRYITWDIVALPTFFVLYILLMCLRSETLGRDLPSYKYIFAFWGHASLQNIISQPKEMLFHSYCWIVYHYISDSFHVFLVITALLTVIPIAYVYCRDKRQGFLKIALFVNMSTFVMTFSGIRQALAFAAGILAYQALIDEKRLRFFLWALAASFIHHTGFMVFCFYPLFLYRFRKKDLIWIAPVMAAVVILNRQIFNMLSSFLGSYSDDYGVLAENTGAYSSFILFVLFTFFSYIVMDEEKADTETIFLRNILAFASVIQSFASLNALAMRMNYYFIILLPMALGKSIGCSRKRYEQVSKFAEIVICVYFSIVFIMNTYQSAVTGISALDTVPYVPFWRD